MSIISFFSLNGTEITEHNRKYDSGQYQQLSDVETASGRLKRFYKNNKKVMKFQFSYLPSLSSKTVDGRVARDFLHNLALNNPNVTVQYQDEPSAPVRQIQGFISNYSESIVRRDLQTQCTYYDIDFVIEEK